MAGPHAHTSLTSMSPHSGSTVHYLPGLARLLRNMTWTHGSGTPSTLRNHSTKQFITLAFATITLTIVFPKAIVQGLDRVVLPNLARNRFD